jgi:hypothetical protein
MIAEAFRDALERCDVEAIRKLFRHSSPHLPQPESDYEALVSIHRARTEASSIPLRMRSYSHAWLVERGYPSGLPDELKPKAERLYPVVAEGVGIAVIAKSELMKPIALLVRAAMSDAVMEAYADKRTSPDFVKARMAEAKRETIRRLVG